MVDADDIAVRTPIRQRFGRVGGALRPGLRGFWSWWTRALVSWLPLRLRELLGLEEQRLLLRQRGDALAIALERAGGQRELARLPWAADAEPPAEDVFVAVLRPQLMELPRWLVLPAEAALRRRLILPAAAAERLRDVLAFEIDRQTPFAAADVYFDAHPLGRAGDGQLQVELVVVPRAALDNTLARLGAPGRALAGVDLDAEGEALGVNLLPQAQRHRRIDPWQRWNLALAAIALLAIAAALWQVLDNRRAAADAFERESQQRIEQARLASAQRQQLTDLVEGMRFLQQTRAGRPTMVELLDELSRKLPDNTYLEKLAIESDRLLLIGLSTEASTLVRQMEDSQLWRSPALTGALMPDPRSRRDRFTLTAEVAVDTPATPTGIPATTGGADAQRGP